MLPPTAMRRSFRILTLAAPLLWAAVPAARAQLAPAELTPVVVTATRLPESSATVGTDVESVSGADLEREQVSNFGDALAATLAAPVFATGQAGADESVFLRGADSDQTLFLVDGIRLNDANTDYGGFLGGSQIFSNERMEVALGPQSTLYGGGAAGGVVSLSMPKGAASGADTISVEGGSFGTIDGAITAQGAGGPWDYNLGLGAERTENDRANNDFDSADLAFRLDDALARYVSVGFTLRGFLSDYQDPGDIITDDPYAYEKEANWLATIFFDLKWTEYISSHIILGGQERVYDAFDGDPSVETAELQRRGLIDWQNTLLMSSANKMVLGLTAEADEDQNDGFGYIDQRQNLLGLYEEDEFTLFRSLYLTEGARLDDYDTFGSATTERLTAAWVTDDKVLKIRGSYGTAFNPPSFLDLYGVGPGYVGNPNLQPERSQGWDFGFDYYLPDSTGRLSLTYFQSDFENLIEDNFNVYPATTENIEQARTRGLELAYRAQIGPFVADLDYTRLIADDLTDATTLLRRPHYTANADLSIDFGNGWSAGGGIGLVGIRADVSALTYEDITDPGYAVARVYLAWKVSRDLSLKARVENLLDRQYQPVNGYPALGRGVYAGVDYKF